MSELLGKPVTMAPDVYVTDHNHAYADVEVPISRQWPQSEAVTVGAGCWIGAGAALLSRNAVASSIRPN